MWIPIWDKTQIWAEISDLWKNLRFDKKSQIWEKKSQIWEKDLRFEWKMSDWDLRPFVNMAPGLKVSLKKCEIIELGNTLGIWFLRDYKESFLLNYNNRLKNLRHWHKYGDREICDGKVVLLSLTLFSTHHWTD